MTLAAIVIARNPAQYGFDFEPETPAEYEKVMLEKPVDLRRIAEWSETTIDEIQTLNPELRRWTTPVRDKQYELKVPMGKAEQVSARLSEAEVSELASLNYYTAKKGDTLALIAKKLKVSRTDLAEANYLSSKARVSVGQKLMVPREATVLMAARAADAPAVTSEKTPDGKTEKPAAVVQASRTLGDDDVPEAVANAERVKVIYSVKRGDTLFSIAQLFKTTVDAIRTWNRIPGDRIAAGQRLTLYR